MLCIIADCGGHPRSLEVLHNLLRETATQGSMDKREVNYTTLSMRMERQFVSYGRFASSLNLAILKPVLLGTKLKLSDVVVLPNKTVQHFVSNGTYVNALESSDDLCIVPTVPLLHVRMWALATKDGEPGLERDIARAVADYMLTGIAWPVGPAAGRYLEFYHAGWEFIVRTLCAGTKQTFGEHYRGAVEKPGSKLLSAQFTYYSECGITKSDKHWSGSHSGNLSTSVHLPGEGNPGFDVVHAVLGPTGKQLPVAVELKFSDVAAGTYLSEETMDAKTVATAKCFPDFVLVLVSTQRIAQDVLEERKWANRSVLVVPPTAIRELYGPTLGTTPQFCVSLWCLVALPPSPARITPQKRIIKRR